MEKQVIKLVTERVKSSVGKDSGVIRHTSFGVQVLELFCASCVTFAIDVTLLSSISSSVKWEQLSLLQGVFEVQRVDAQKMLRTMSDT